MFYFPSRARARACVRFLFVINARDFSSLSLSLSYSLSLPSLSPWSSLDRSGRGLHARGMVCNSFVRFEVEDNKNGAHARPRSCVNHVSLFPTAQRRQ